jgi:RHS repeat-associated protein
MFRPIEVDFPDFGQTVTSYPDANHSIVQSKIDGARSTCSTKLFDGYGRLSRKAEKNDESTPYDQQDFCYDANGRLAFQSYVYQGSGFGIPQVCSGAGDAFTYDALGRSVKVQHSDGTFSTISYAGLATQTTDEGNGTVNVSRISQRDGLGRLASVCEVYSGAPLMGSGGTPAGCGLDISGSGFLTTYGYDIAGNLSTITQGALTSRTYAYDSLSRMTSESTPEGGTVAYNYNADGMLAQRVRPAPNQADATKTITTVYGYDELHRALSSTYTSSDPINHPVNTGSPSFNYDETNVWSMTLTNTSGRVTSEIMQSPPGSGSTVVTAKQIFSYDSMGRPTLNAQCTPNTCNATPFSPYSLGYQYDLLGNVVSAGNGVGVNFGYSYNIFGRLTGMTSSLNDAGHPGTLLSNAHYSPLSITDTLGNGVMETLDFSPRAMLTSYTGTAPNGQPGTGSVIISGVLQTYQQQTQAATPASVTVTLGGSDSSNSDTVCTRTCRTFLIKDSGTIQFSVNVGGATVGPVQASYSGSSTLATLATALFQNFPANSLVTMSNPNGSASFTLTTIATGTVANNTTISASITSSCQDTDFIACSGPGWTISPSQANLTGGNNAVFQTVYDNGSTSITVNSHSDSYTWGAPSTTAASIAQGLCNTINFDSGAFIIASTGGAPGQCPLGSTTLTLASKQGGQNYSLSASSNSVVSSFSTGCPGFPSCTSASLTGGGNPAYSFTLGHAANGQVTSANDLVNGNWAFGYDQFNRLASSNKNSGQQTFSYAYDRYSNRWQQNAPQGGPSALFMFDNNNHFVGSGVTYDALGNVTNDGFHSYTYDDENRLIQADGGATAAYGYDADGRRVHGPNGEYVYDLDGRTITQIALNGVWAYGEIYAGGSHLATYSGSTTNFLHSDWLGTKRVMTSLNGVSSQTCTGFAFGDGVSCTGTNLGFNGFTDDIHDPETNLEHTLFRQFSGTQGRWLTPDPAGMSSMNTANPQSINRYAYVMNDPVNSVDPLGLEIDPGAGGCFMDINCTNVGGVDFATWISHYVGMQCNVDGVQEDCAFASFLLRAGKAGVQVGTTQVRVEFPGGTDSDWSWLPGICCDAQGDTLEVGFPVYGMMTRRDAVYVSIAVIDSDSIPPDIAPTKSRQALINLINCGRPWPFPCGPITISNGDPTYHPPAHPTTMDVVACFAGLDPELNGGPDAKHVPEGNTDKARLESFSPSGRAKQNDPAKRWGRPLSQKNLKAGNALGGVAAYAGNTANCIGTSNMH